MALVLADRVKETTTSIGTGTITLAGAVAGFQSFAVVGDANTTYYTISGGSQWEVGIGTYTSSGTTLSRDTVLSSSSAGALVDFAAGTKDVFVTYPAERSVYTTASAELAIPAPGTTGNVLTSNGSIWTSSAIGGSLPVGTLQYFAGPTTSTYPGSSWLQCLGGIVSQSTYSALYQNIGLIPNTGAATWTSVNPDIATLSSLIYANSLFVSVGGFGVISTSTDGLTWTSRTSGTSSTLYGIAYGNGVYVYGGNRTGAVAPALATSTDAITWTSRTFSATTLDITALTYGTVFVAGCSNGAIGTSTNGITWTARFSGTSSQIRTLVYGNSLYVLGGDGGSLRTSTDGATWTARTSGTGNSILSLTYGAGVYVYGAGGGVIATSTDAITWTAQTSGTAQAIYSLAYLNGQFIYAASVATGGTTGVLATSTDAITWSAQDPGNTGSLGPNFGGSGVVYGNSRYVVSASLYPLFTSTNVVSWSVVSSVYSNGSQYAVEYNDNIYVVAGTGVYTSTDFTTFTARTIPTNRTIRALTYGVSLHVYAGDGGVLATSTDAITWTARTSGTSSAINALTYGNSLYVYAGNGGALATSTDAITWTARTSGTASNIIGLTYGNSLYVYAGAGGVLATSTNAITWTARTSGTSSAINALIYANGLYTYAGAGGVLATSTDAITWTARTSGTTSAISALAYSNGLYIYSGTAVLATSVDAITWTARTSGLPAGYAAQSVVYGGSYAGYVGTLGIRGYSSLFTYNPTSEFALPLQSVKPTSLGEANLFIKATV